MEQEGDEYSDLWLEAELEDIELELDPDVSEIGVDWPSKQPAAAANVSKDAPFSVGEAHSTDHDAPGKKKQKTQPRRIVRPDSSCTLEEVLTKANDILDEALHKNLGDIKQTPLGQEVAKLVNQLDGQKQAGNHKFADYLVGEMWAIASCGDHLPTGVAANSAMWSKFHAFRVNKEVHEMWNTFLKDRGVRDPTVSTSATCMLLQEVLQNTLNSIMLLRNTAFSCAAKSASEMDNHDEQVLQYVAGFVPFALCKKFRRQKSDNAAQFVNFLQGLKAEGDEETAAESFVSYTYVWTTLQNRGGLFIVNENAYKLFRAMEMETRKNMSSNFLQEGRDEALKGKLTEKLSSCVYVQRLWSEMQGEELTNGDILLKTIINYWVEIRLRAFVKVYLEQQNREQSKQRREKGLRKELRKKSKTTK